MRVDELETSVPVVDTHRLKANISPLQTYLNEHGIANRPHIKTHKFPQIVQTQIDAGTVGAMVEQISPLILKRLTQLLKPLKAATSRLLPRMVDATMIETSHL